MSVVLPLGNDRFRELREAGFYYIDKTGFIKELLWNQFKVTLITRPRRFGKTLTMSMLEDFFDIRTDSSKDFAGLSISSDFMLCEKWMNQWPVLFFTLKSVEGSSFEDAYGMLKNLISDLCIKHSYLENSNKIDEGDLKQFAALKLRTADRAEVKNSLYVLTRMLTAYYGKSVILLIDEYDVPLAHASEAGYYREMLDIIRSMLGKVLKTNEFLKLAVLTGCLKIAKESIFTGLNNFVSDTITGDRFDEYFGFTETDVHKLLEDTGLISHAAQIKKWYDGYRFGTAEVYCPWDVLNYVSELQINPKREPQNYWENTSHNGIIKTFISRDELEVNEKFEILLSGGCLIETISENLTYDMKASSEENLWSLLYLTGYLTQADPVKLKGNIPEGRKAVLRIPNEEIKSIFKTAILGWFEETVKKTDRSSLFDALWNGDEKNVSDKIADLLFHTISYYDYREDFYHAFIVGILMYSGYKVKSNREQGEGRSDILLLDDRRSRAAVLEIKRAHVLKEMDASCDMALKQIHDRSYAEELKEDYEEILCYGISFYKKRCKVKVDKVFAG